MGHPDGATLRYVVFDILEDFKQAYSQADVSEYQLTYWVLIHADRLKKQHIQKIDSGEYLAIYPNVSVSQDSNGNKYITLPARIYDFDLDKGVSFITYDQRSGDDHPVFTNITFGRTTPAKAKRLSMRPQESPSPDNPYFYRVGDKLYFLGLSDVSVPTVEVGIYQTLNPADLSLDIDQPFDFPQDLIPILKRQVLDLGLFALNVPSDLKNDGVSEQGELPQKKFISVNDLNEQTS
jgi:hypothetical protein